MTTATGTNLTHRYYCTNRPGETEPRIERYDAPRYAPDGVTKVAAVRVVRCLECAAASYDGVQPQEY